MRKLWNRVLKMIKESDVVIEVLDARVPFETRSMKLEEITEKFGKKLFIVINKSDLVPSSFLREIKQKLKEEGKKVFVASTTERKGALYLKKVLKRMSRKKDIRVCFVGYPNTGKSSLINFLALRQSARTSSQPGFTKGEQWIVLKKVKKEKKGGGEGRILLLDTPGVLPIEEGFSIIKGNVRVEREESLIPYVVDFLNLVLNKENNFAEKYNIEETNDGETFLERTAEKFNMRTKGGNLDLERASRKIIADWNSGKLSAWWV